MRQVATVTSQAMRESGTPGVFSPAEMTPALTPVLALGYLRELSADIRDGVVLAAGGELLAGEPALAAPARELLEGMDSAAEAEGWSASGAALAARGPRLAIVLACGPQTLTALGRHDLRLVLGDLGEGSPAAAGHVAGVAPELVERLCSAAQRGPGD